MLFGGMWPVALTDFFQMIIIVVGMLYIGWVVSGYAGDVGNVVASIYKTVENAYKVTLVAAFVPLVSGLYWKRANTQGALFAIALGVSSWLLLEIFHSDGLWPPQLFGLLMSLTGMLVGSLISHKRRI